MYTQILTATENKHGHLTWPFPLCYGQMTQHGCWVQVGQRRDDVAQRTDYNHRFYTIHLDPKTGKWTTPKCQLTASIILLYIHWNPTLNHNSGLPETLSLNLNHPTTAQEIRAFVNPPFNLHTPLPTRYFNRLQRDLITKALLKREDLEPVLWLEPIDINAVHQLQTANDRLNIITTSYKVEKLTEKQLKRQLHDSPAAQQTRYFKLYTKRMLTEGQPPPHDGWPDAESLISTERKLMAKGDPKWLTDPMTLERWATYEAVYTYWNDLPKLAEVLNWTAPAILRQAALYEEATGHQYPFPTQP